MKLFVSVIIPVRNGQHTLKKCLDSVRKLDYPNFEVIVINDGSTDGTAHILSEYSDFKIISTRGVGPSRARNVAIGKAKGEFVAFTDADCIIDNKWLNNLLAGFTSDEIVGVGGIQLSPEDETDFGRDIQRLFKRLGFITDYLKSAKKKIETTHNPTCNVMYRKKAILDAGGFLEGLWPGEDLELDYRLRKKGNFLIFNPDAVVYHYRPNTLGRFCKMMFNYGKAQGFLVKKYGFFRKIHYEPLIFTMIIVSLGILITLGINPVFFFSAALFLFLLIYFYTRRWRIPFLFLLILIFWNIGFFIELVKRGSKN